MTFEELGVSAPICRAVAELGYQQPMPVQEAVIPFLLGEPIDLIALAQTGTGKTAAFGLPLLQNVERSLSSSGGATGVPRALVLCPTRELCLQIADDLTAYSKYLPSVRILPVYGGSSIEAQIRTLRRGVEVILLLFSATMPREISSIAASYMHEPKEIIVGTKNEGNKNIRHYYYVVSARHKYLALKRIADYYPDIYGIIFCRTRKETQEIADQLIRDGYNADALHGELSQAQRDYVMQKFRIRNLQLLVATDVAARGLDVDDLTHVIHYGLPDDIESYTHRSGRTARAGKLGISIAICHSRERGRLRDIERISHATIERKQLPSGSEICQKQLFHLADRIERVELTDDTTLDTVLPDLVRKLDWIDREELVRRLMLLEHRRLLDYYESEEVIEEADDKGRLPSEPKEGKKRDKRNAVAEEGMKRLFINFGKLDRMFPNKLIELINKCVPGRVKIGKIDLLPRFSFFEVEEADAQEVIRSMSSYEVDGRRIAVDYADALGSEGSGRKERRPKRSAGGFDSERKPHRKGGARSGEGAFDKYKDKDRTKRSRSRR